MSLEKLLKTMADGEFHSSEDIGRALDVSPAAVGEQLSMLQHLGLELESRDRGGYRIAHRLDLLDATTIRRRMERSGQLGVLEVLPEVDSTNQRALEVEMLAGKAYVCLAEFQQAGRGRHGRTWVSPVANSIYLSLAWEFEGGATALEGLSLAVGVAILRALECCGISGPNLKWPNDIVCDGRKLGGVLIELSGDISGHCRAVIGIGLNGALRADSAADIDIPVTDLATLAGLLPDRNGLAAALLDELLDLVSTFESTGFAAWREAWSANDSLAGRTVQIHLGEEQITGSARGVDDRGSLLLDTSEGIKSFNGGEVSLKPMGD
jgi:BirA family biotin operon repressor/biotin-[acetyl-CoA-carboxylase] ligase